jgi:hypothetical protein
MCAKLDTTGLLADVAYAIFRGDGEAEVGRERCRLYRRADGGYWMTADLDQSWPFPHTLYVEIRAGADWRVESVQVRLANSLRRDALYRADGLTWRAMIQTDEVTVERAVPFGPETFVEFGSVWLNTLALNRLELAPGQSREVDAIQIELPLLEPVPGRLRYESIGPERIATPAGEWDATHYVVSGAEHLWADSRGIVLATSWMMDGLPHRHKLLGYHWLG